MLLRTCLSLGGLALLYALVVHLRNHWRSGGGVVLVAVMLCFQAIFHPSAEQVIAQQYNDTAEDDEAGDDEEPSPPEAQMRRQAKRIRSGESYAPMTLRLSRSDLRTSHEDLVESGMGPPA